MRGTSPITFTDFSLHLQNTATANLLAIPVPRHAPAKQAMHPRQPYVQIHAGTCHRLLHHHHVRAPEISVASVPGPGW